MSKLLKEYSGVDKIVFNSGLSNHILFAMPDKGLVNEYEDRYEFTITSDVMKYNTIVYKINIFSIEIIKYLEKI